MMRTAEQLGISKSHHSALIKFVEIAEAGALVHVTDIGRLPVGASVGDALFSMSYWDAETPCGTVGCIGGWVERLRGRILDEDDNWTTALGELYYPSIGLDYSHITPEQAARATRNFLEVGYPNWDAVLAGKEVE